MKKKHILTRRTALITGVSALASYLLYRTVKSPETPTYGNILRAGDNFTYEAQRALLSKKALAKEYSRSEISSFPAVGTIDPGDEKSPTFSKDYAVIRREGFSGWTLSVEGRVARPGSYSLAALQSLPARTQITRHSCEEGWTAVAEWTGIPLSGVLLHAGIFPSARFVNFYAYDGYQDSIDMIDAFHPQTLLAYGMNGKALPIQHGAPLRLRVETQIGYKSMKYLKRLVVTDEYVDPGDSGWAWYTGI
jgi:DMSO/TMAO reductase YedYZ molybdopterin-dependent catalytic subunit